MTSRARNSLMHSESDEKGGLDSSDRRRFVLMTVAVGVFAMLVSLAGVTRVSMWMDEAYTVTVATRSIGDVWRMVHEIDVVHSMYNVLLHPWLALAGVSDVSVRIPSTLAVGLATGGTMVLGRQLAGVRVALASGLIFAILPRVTWMGIEGRSYAGTAALAVWLTVLFVSLLRRPTRYKYFGYAVLGAAAGSLNIFLLLLLGAHGLTLLLDRRYRFRAAFWQWLWAALAALAGALPVLLTAATQAGQIGMSRLGLTGYGRAILVNQWFLGDTPTVYEGGSLGEGPESGLWKYASVLLACACWLVVAYGLSRRGTMGHDADGPAARPLLLCWLVVPTALLVGYALTASPLYNPRYLTFCTPALALLLGLGLVRIRSDSLRAQAVLAIVLLALPVYLVQRSPFGKSGADWQSIAKFVQERRGPDQAVYFAPRTPPESDVVVGTSRITQTLYPEAFVNIRDLTLVSTAAADGLLVDRSRLLTASANQLTDIQAVFVIQRRDYPSEAVRTDAEFLYDRGFRRAESWVGPLNRVTEYVRTPDTQDHS